jgi:3-hydroxybutyryl-CoA dehydratase
MSAALAGARPGDVVATHQSEVITRQMLASYAEASGDLNPLHLDPRFAHKAGFPDVIVHGMLGMALLGRMLSEHFSSEHLCSFDARFTGIIPVDETLQCTAKVKAVETGYVQLDLQASTSAGVVAITGSARIRVA